jgi:DNA-binding LacI/PurR family transcriptional regulator
LTFVKFFSKVETFPKMETFPLPIFMNVTIREVAQKAEVGLGTVSRVLNNSPLVSPTTRERVLQAIEELNFVPNQNARRLSMGKTLTIGVIIPFFTRPSFTPRLSGVESALSETQFDLLISNVDIVSRRDNCFRDFTQRNRVDGLLVISLPPLENEVPLLSSAAVPVVLIDVNNTALTDFHRVTVDDVLGGKRATEHLIRLGHSRIGMVGDPLITPFNFTSSRDRYVGYRQALEEAGILFNPDYFREGQHGRHHARALAIEILSGSMPPTAIFAASDTQALGVMEAARDLGLSVPDDLSVMGYDDVEVAEYLNLTTTRQQLFESGQVGAEILLELIANPDDHFDPFHVTIPTELVVRGTTAPPKDIL